MHHRLLVYLDDFWRTAGLTLQPNHFLFITANARCLVASSDRTQDLLQHHLLEMGFQLKEFVWQDGSHTIINDLAAGRRVGSDIAVGSALDLSQAIKELKLSLTPYDFHRYRKLALRVCSSLEDTCRMIVPGVTRAQVTGELSRRLWIDCIERSALMSHTYGNHRHTHLGSVTTDPIQRFCVVTCLARGFGMTYAASRAVAFAPSDETFIAQHHKVLQIGATMSRFSSPNVTHTQSVHVDSKQYQQLDEEFTWQEATQGALLGYVDHPMIIRPSQPDHLRIGSVVCWRPRVGNAECIDVAIPLENKIQTVHHFQNWPTVSVNVGTVRFRRPDVLITET